MFGPKTNCSSRVACPEAKPEAYLNSLTVSVLLLLYLSHKWVGKSLHG